MTSPCLLPRASLTDVVRGRAPLVGSRLRSDGPRGFASPIEARMHLGVLYEDPLEAESAALSGRSAASDLGLLVRVGLARALGGGAQEAPPEPRPFIVSAHVDNVSIDDAVRGVLEAPRGRGRLVVFVHPHALNLARFDRDLQAQLGRADRVFGDGVGVRLAARVLGTPLLANVNGTDLLPRLCAAASEQGVPLVLVGAKEGVAARCAEKLRGAHPGLSIPMTSHGFLDAPATARVLADIRALGRVVLLVGMGSPIQERWASAARDALPEATVVTVGGLFDFFSGDVPRAPLAVRELGLEWAFRMAQEPRRLARRYLVGNPLFLALACAQRLGSHAPDS